MAGLSEGSPAILWSIRITVNTYALQADDVGSTPIYSSNVPALTASLWQGMDNRCCSIWLMSSTKIEIKRAVSVQFRYIAPRRRHRTPRH